MSASDPLRDAEEAGFDLAHIELNLSLTPDQRVEQHESALTLVREFEKVRAGRDEVPR